MPEIIVTPEILEEVANKVIAQAQAIESACIDAERAMANLRDMKSKRVTRILDAWEALRKAVQENVENIKTTAGQETKAAAVAFANADEQ